MMATNDCCAAFHLPSPLFIRVPGWIRWFQPSENPTEILEVPNKMETNVATIFL